MSDQFEEKEPGETEYSLKFPFIDQSQEFTLGFETGWIYGWMQHCKSGFNQAIHNENTRQLVIAADCLGWQVTFEPLDADFSIMHAQPK